MEVFKEIGIGVLPLARDGDRVAKGEERPRIEGSFFFEGISPARAGT